MSVIIEIGDPESIGRVLHALMLDKKLTEREYYAVSRTWSVLQTIAGNRGTDAGDFARSVLISRVPTAAPAPAVRS